MHGCVRDQEGDLGCDAWEVVGPSHLTPALSPCCCCPPPLNPLQRATFVLVMDDLGKAGLGSRGAAEDQGKGGATLPVPDSYQDESAALRAAVCAAAGGLPESEAVTALERLSRKDPAALRALLKEHGNFGAKVG